MPIVGSFQGAVPRRIDEYHNFRYDIIAENGPSFADVPNCKLHAQDANSTLDPHFHLVNQFQIVTAGSGTFGKHPARPITVHYAGAHSPYGPIVAGPDGISYVVIRDAIDGLAGFMPRDRARLRPGPRRFVIADPIDPLAAEALASLREPLELEVMPPESDGLACWLVRIPAGAVWRGRDPSLGGGQSHLVVAGSVAYDGRALSELSCVHHAPGDGPIEVRADAAGAELVTMQFPRRSGPA